MGEPSPNSLLADEYAILQKRVEEFDSRLLTIKAWSVTFAAAGIGFAFQQYSPKLLLISAVSALAFWMVETIVKSHQRAHYPRIDEIEEHFSGKTTTAPLQISQSWHSSFHSPGRIRRYFRHARYAVVCLPHLLIIIAALSLYFFSPPMSQPERRPRLSVIEY